jgi:hypothetical protein
VPGDAAARAAAAIVSVMEAVVLGLMTLIRIGEDPRRRHGVCGLGVARVAEAASRGQPRLLLSSPA